MPEPAVTAMCPICGQEVPVRLAPSGVLRLARHQISGSAPSQGDSCKGIGWEVDEQ